MANLTTKTTRRSRSCDDLSPRPLPPIPADASPGRRWRFRRNVVIYVAHRNGLSQRLLADVFDLPRSRIGAIIKEIESKASPNLSPSKEYSWDAR